MRKYVSLLAFFVILSTFSLSFPITTSAKTYSYWYSNENRIGFVNNRNIWGHNLKGGFTDSQYFSYLNHAKNQWKSAGIPTYGANEKSSSIIHWYAGLQKDLEALEPSLRGKAAVTLVNGTLHATGRYNGKTVYNYQLTSAKIFTPKKLLFTAKKYRTMFTHELGHALGYLGHSTSRSDLMHASGSTDMLTTRDKRHLGQNY